MAVRKDALWTVPLLDELCRMVHAGDSLERIAHHFGASWLQIWGACDRYGIGRPSREWRGHPIAGTALKVVRQQYRAAPKPVLLADRRRIAAADSEIEQAERAEEARKNASIGRTADRAADIEADALRQVAGWQAAGLSPQQACRRMGELESASWAIVAAHLRRRLADRCDD
jgi:hypothetical protein